MAKLTKCPNGHFYDAERSPQCPYCAAPSTPEPPPPPDGSVRTETLQEEAMNRTAPIQEETVGRTVPLQEETVGRTVPLQEDGIGRTMPLENAGTPVQKPAGDRERELLSAAAVMAAVSAAYNFISIFLEPLVFHWF